MLTVIWVGVVSWPVGLTISHCVPPVLVDAETLTLTGVPLLLSAMVCGSGALVPVW